MNNLSTPATHEEITHRAFHIWQENGRRPGTADDDWRAAELELAHAQEHNDLSDSQHGQDAVD